MVNPTTLTDFLTADALGSTVAVADGVGGTLTEYSYDPFGVTSAPTTTVANPFQFTGRENDGLASSGAGEVLIPVESRLSIPLRAIRQSIELGDLAPAPTGDAWLVVQARVHPRLAFPQV